ncbi:substrate-binding periplasmic protein [Magnetococcales bacterium HHB-1]
MVCLRYIVPLLFIILPLAESQGRAAVDINALPNPIQICSDQGELPPFTFFERENGQKSKKLTGWSVDVVRHVFSKYNLDIHVELLPWVRCQTWVQEGRRYQIGMEATYSKEREQKFLLSEPYTPGLSGHYFYSKHHYPKGPPLHHSTDLKNYTVCGVHGSNYEPFGIDNQYVDRNSKLYPGLIAKLHANHCDLFLAYYVMLKGLMLVDKLKLDKHLAWRKVPEMAPHALIFLLPRNDVGVKLKTMLDQGIQELKKSGKYSAMKKKYLQ